MTVFSRRYDLRGNPIEIAAAIVWRVDDTARASFDVQDFDGYVLTQAEAAISPPRVAPRLRPVQKKGQ